MENQTNQKVKEVEQQDKKDHHESTDDNFVDDSFDELQFLPTDQDFEDVFSFC